MCICALFIVCDHLVEYKTSFFYAKIQIQELLWRKYIKNTVLGDFYPSLAS
jgi:hypothetical protein